MTANVNTCEGIAWRDLLYTRRGRTQKRLLYFFIEAGVWSYSWPLVFTLENTRRHGTFTPSLSSDLASATPALSQWMFQVQKKCSLAKCSNSFNMSGRVTHSFLFCFVAFRKLACRCTGILVLVHINRKYRHAFVHVSANSSVHIDMYTQNDGMNK